MQIIYMAINMLLLLIVLYFIGTLSGIVIVKAIDFVAFLYLYYGEE